MPVQGLLEKIITGSVAIGAMAVICYLILKAFERSLDNQKGIYESILEEMQKASERNLDNQKSTYESILAEMQKRETNNFTLLKDYAETLQYLVGQLSRMEQKIDTNQSCPIVREKQGAALCPRN